MKKTVRGLAARIAPAPIKSRLRDGIGGGAVDGSNPAPDWSVESLTRVSGGWQLTLAVPGEAFRGISLVLAGRTNGDVRALQTTLGEGTATVELGDEWLSWFAGEVVDLWLEPLFAQEPSGWRRLSAANGQLQTAGRSPSSGAARWYVTRKGNVSIEVPHDRHDQPRDTRARLARLEQVGAAARLVVRDAGPAAPGSSLVLMGSSTRREVVVELQGDSVEYEAVVAIEHLASFGSEVVDVFVGNDDAAGMTRVRRRLAAGVELSSAIAPGWSRRWFTTAEGHVSLRRRTPVEAIVEAGTFDVEYYRSQVPDLPAGVDPVEHYVTTGAAAGLNPSTMFDTEYYRQMNPGIRGNGLAHYSEFGWREFRNPSPAFDTWWYWAKHMGLIDEGVAPLAHYEAQGKREGLSTRPSLTPSRELGTGFELPDPASVRRVCLFAAYDAQGIVDDYVVAYLTELSKYADVYYWADSDMPDSELAKLEGVTRAAWAVRHGEYDFGSYARLVEAVGWDVIEQYDELLLVNDSCYLLRPLDQVFAEMGARRADWWALQATKGMAQTRHMPVNQFLEPIPVTSVRTSLVDAFERDYTYDFHLGSYFVAYRQPVITDPEFRRYIGSVTRQTNKRTIVKAYEIGLTRWLIHHGHQFDTFVSKVYPFHPVYSEWYFRLLDEGFPVLKRYLLAENHYNVPRLDSWKERVLAKAPDADVEMFDRNLRRVTDPEKLRRTLGIGGEDGVADEPVPDVLLTPAEFAEADVRSPKHASWWAFPVCAFTKRFSGNERAIFEAVKDDPTIKKIVLTRGLDVTVDGVNVEVMPLQSPEGQHRLMRSGNILIKHSRSRNLVYPVSAELHNLIQVWHGIPLKRISYASADFLGALDKVAADTASYRAVISSSKVDSLAMAAAFYPLTIHQVWNTGLPRNDFILRAEDELPADFQAELERLRTIVDGRMLVLFMPTFRNAQTGGYYHFSPEEISWLGEWLETNNAVLGVREHMADKAHLYSQQLAGVPMVDLSDAAFPNVEVLYRVSSALVTDYSSAFIDYMLTGKPAISFAYDYQAYLMERGTFYDLDHVFPGPVCQTFEDVKAALGSVLTGETDPAYDFKRRIFFDRVDDHSSARVVEKIRDLAEAHGVGKPPGERTT
ncbi:CDP-glycerol glycerophosphotransferase family protein [Cellulomonas edaphi]|uniref:CDP-glycerol glycerophosphotransferase family protein n=1 Tax=Cellulomonas edaphi TaxID=3053468 RepID=A0ABT7S7Z8_9CELL|nr:CDP-glycerol glycerophosphotransferase family protein [Cellulomons edaphi]MDM7831753.1 CDP-glycerol glycerophosphotransferase family protein [Cellulomons edaphi]